jgi:hypothetical protein
MTAPPIILVSPTVDPRLMFARLRETGMRVAEILDLR